MVEGRHGTQQVQRVAGALHLLTPRQRKVLLGQAKGWRDSRPFMR
jgi:hypothetical protein